MTPAEKLQERAEECRVKAEDLRARAIAMTLSRFEIENIADQWDRMAAQLEDIAKGQK
jgi:hypothetical protein